MRQLMMAFLVFFGLTGVGQNVTEENFVSALTGSWDLKGQCTGSDGGPLRATSEKYAKIKIVSLNEKSGFEMYRISDDEEKLEHSSVAESWRKLPTVKSTLVVPQFYLGDELGWSSLSLNSIVEFSEPFGKSSNRKTIRTSVARFRFSEAKQLTIEFSDVLSAGNVGTNNKLLGLYPQFDVTYFNCTFVQTKAIPAQVPNRL